MKTFCLLTVLFIHQIASSAQLSGEYTLNMNELNNCPEKLSIVQKSPSFFQTVFTFDDSSKRFNNFDLEAPKGLIKGLLYPLGVFSYYRNYHDETGLYFQRKNCERIGVFKECEDWKNIQTYRVSKQGEVQFELTDLFYRIDGTRYPADLGLLPLFETCIYQK